MSKALLISESASRSVMCLTLCDPMDYTVHGILQARILEWVAISFSRDLPDPGIEPRPPALQADCLMSEPPGKPKAPSSTGSFFFNYFFLIFISWRLITSQHFSGFCHTLTWISHGFTSILHPYLPSHLPLHPIPLGLPSAPGPSTCLMHPTWAGDLFHSRQYTCCSFETSHPHLLPQSPKVCSVHLCLFFCFAYRVIITIFLNSIYMC